jgi:F-type H+-transporting ATPase subunit epsilon
MSENSFKLTVVTPDKCLLKDEPTLAVGAFGSLGAFTALPGHEPFLTDLKPSEAWYRNLSGEDRKFFVSGGFVEVLPTLVTILADAAEWLEDIDQERAERDQRLALKRLADAKLLVSAPQEGAVPEKARLTPEEEEARKKERMEIFRAEAALARATARVKAARNRRDLPRKS